MINDDHHVHAVQSIFPPSNVFVGEMRLYIENFSTRLVSLKIFKYTILPCL